MRMLVEIWKEDGCGDPTDIILRNPGDVDPKDFLDAAIDQLRDEYDCEIDDHLDLSGLPEDYEMSADEVKDFFSLRQPERVLVRYVSFDDDDAEDHYSEFCDDSDMALLVEAYREPVPDRWEVALRVRSRRN